MTTMTWAHAARRCLALCTVAAGALTAGCASIYVDTGTKEVPVAQYRRAEPVRPVQVLLEFQTKGVANAQATQQLKARVIDQVKASGLFASVSEEPVDGGALLGITLNNVPMSGDAFSKGFVTGLTFGLAGTQVGDGYVCTASYARSAATGPIVKQGRHAIHTTIGAAAAPANGEKVASIDVAVTMMTRQVLSHVLHALTLDPAFH